MKKTNTTLLLVLLNFTVLLSQISLIQERCLTNDPAQDRYASYSPNGKQIVFESDRAGNWDIYVMDADGKTCADLPIMRMEIHCHTGLRKKTRY